MKASQLNRISDKILNEASFTPQQIAKKIYDSKGVVWDDEKSAINAVEQIKNLTQYKEVLKALQKLTGGRGLGQYLKSFTNLQQRLDIVNHLKSFIPKNQWGWTIEYIIPWDDFKYLNSKSNNRQSWTAGQNNAATAMIQYYSDKGKWKAGGPNIDAEFWKDYHHEILMAAEIVSYMIPVIGPAVALGIAGLDAKMYWDEGDKYTAGFVATLSIIPVIGSLATKIPGVKKLGAKGAVALAEKMKLIKGGSKPALTTTEKQVIQQLGKNQKLIQTETQKYIAKKTAAKTLVGKTAKLVGTVVAQYKVSKAAWDTIYTKSGIAASEVDALIKPSLDKLARRAKQLSTTRTESKLSLDTIIREELYAIREQFKSSGKSGSASTSTTKTSNNKNDGTGRIDYTDTGKEKSSGSKTGDALKNYWDNTSGASFLIGGAIMAFMLYKGFKFAKNRVLKAGDFAKLYGKTGVELFRDPKNVVKTFRELQATGSVDKLIRDNRKFFKNWTPEQIEGLKNAVKDPAALTGTLGMLGTEGVEQFLKGNMNATALKSMLSPELQKAYGPFIDAIEKSRVGATKTTPGMYTSTSTATVTPKPATPAPSPTTPKPSGTKSPYSVQWPEPGGEWTKI